MGHRVKRVRYQIHFVDGASNAQGSGVGLILISLEGIDIEYALRFGFHTSKKKPSMRLS